MTEKISFKIGPHAEELITQGGTIHITISRKGIGQSWIARATSASGRSGGPCTVDTCAQHRRWEHYHRFGGPIDFDMWLAEMLGERVDMAARDALTYEVADPASCDSGEAPSG